MTTTETTKKTPVKPSKAAWTVGEVATSRPIPVLPLPRLVRVLESLGKHLAPEAPRDGIRTVAGELGEAPADVGAIAMALLRRVDTTNLRNQAPRPLASRDARGEPVIAQSVEPAAAVTFEERVAASVARDLLLTELDAAIEDRARARVMRDRLIYLRQRVRDDAPVDQEADVGASTDQSWHRDAVYADLRDWLTEDVAPATLNKQVDRLWEYLFDHRPALGQAFVAYLTARADVRRAVLREGGIYARRPGYFVRD